MSELSQLDGKQIAAARALLRLAQPDLAKAAGISVPTLRRMEASDGPVAGLRNNVLAVQRALEEAGVVFLDEGEVSATGGAGVRLKPPLKAFMMEPDEDASLVPPPFRHDYTPTPEPGIQPKGS
jgi:transcriptional regulator with XRE-family HTH domain